MEQPWRGLDTGSSFPHFLGNEGGGNGLRNISGHRECHLWCQGHPQEVQRDPWGSSQQQPGGRKGQIHENSIKQRSNPWKFHKAKAKSSSHGNSMEAP